MKTAENKNDNEIKSLAAELSSIEKKEVFSAPANYFDSLPNQIMDKISAVPQLEESAVSNPFTVPNNYFEGLPMQVINRMEAARKRRFSLAGLLAETLRPKYSLTLITSCLALLICIRFFEKPIRINPTQSRTYGTYNVSISETDVIIEVDESTLMNVVSEESAILLKTGNNLNNRDKSVEEYIINNNIDVTDIAKEL
jgi:hypothetical protein